MLAVDASGSYLDIFSLAYHLSFFYSLWPDIDRNIVSKGHLT